MASLVTETLEKNNDQWHHVHLYIGSLIKQLQIVCLKKLFLFVDCDHHTNISWFQRQPTFLILLLP